MCVVRWGGVIFYGKTLGSLSRGMSTNQSANLHKEMMESVRTFLGVCIPKFSKECADEL